MSVPHFLERTGTLDVSIIRKNSKDGKSQHLVCPSHHWTIVKCCDLNGVERTPEHRDTTQILRTCNIGSISTDEAASITTRNSRTPEQDAKLRENCR